MFNGDRLMFNGDHQIRLYPPHPYSSASIITTIIPKSYRIYDLCLQKSQVNKYHDLRFIYEESLRNYAVIY